MEAVDYKNNLTETSKPAPINEIYYNCCKCHSPIEIISINEKKNIIKFKCIKNHKVKRSINDYIDQMKKFNDKKINNDICLDHKIKYECFCFECNKHLCKN